LATNVFTRQLTAASGLSSVYAVFTALSRSTAAR
jgi:hypothetical protein